MKYGSIIITALFVTLIVFYSKASEKDEARGYHVKVGDDVKNIVFILTDGDTLLLNKLKGKVVVLQFTASWCSVCRKEMPHLEKEVWQAYKDDDFILIGIDYDEPLDKVIAFKEKMRVTYPMALDPDGNIFQEFAIKGAGVTRNVVIDKSGKIAYLTRLFDMEEFEGMKKKIAELLNE
jgi:peroxiredoxin